MVTSGSSGRGKHSAGAGPYNRSVGPTWDDVRRCLGARTASAGAGGGNDRRAAVALILRDGAAGIELLFIRRAEHPMDPWSGQMAFPGGRAEPGDRDLEATAIRETLEEIGLDLGEAERLGALDEVRAMARMRPMNLTIQPVRLPRPRAGGPPALRRGDERALAAPGAAPRRGAALHDGLRPRGVVAAVPLRARGRRPRHLGPDLPHAARPRRPARRHARRAPGREGRAHHRGVRLRRRGGHPGRPQDLRRPRRPRDLGHHGGDGAELRARDRLRRAGAADGGGPDRGRDLGHDGGGGQDGDARQPRRSSTPSRAWPRRGACPGWWSTR